MNKKIQNVCAITQKELKHYFYSPIAYVVLMIFLTISGYFFYGGVVRFSEQYKYYKNIVQFSQNTEMLQRMNLNEFVIAPALFNMIFVFLFMLPLIMMRSFSEEKARKTDELLKTSPITSNEVIAGKFLGSFLFILAMVLPTIIYQVVLFFSLSSPPEWGPVITGYAGILLFGASGVSIGLFASSLTENQIIGAVITFVVLLFMFIINFLSMTEGTFMYDVIKYISVADHVRNLLRGMFDSRDVVYFLSIITLFLFLTKRAMTLDGWR